MLFHWSPIVACALSYNSTKRGKFHLTVAARANGKAGKSQRMNDLREAARCWGIEPGYHDVFGKWHEASPDTLAQMVAMLSKGRTEPAQLPPVPARAPIRAWQGDTRRHWLLAVQLYGLRSLRNWGIGDFTDLANLIPIAAAHGASGIGLNPLHALFAEWPERASPYAPNSRLYINPLYIDVEAVPEFRAFDAPGLKKDAARLRETELVDYPAVARAKIAGLRLAHERFRNLAAVGRREDFELFRQAHGEPLLRFACFEVLRREQAPKPWPDWPEPWRTPDRASLESYRQAHIAEVEFHEYVQWIADTQLSACKHAARKARMPVGLYIDLAVGIHPHSADAWSQQNAVLSAMSVGAPPDELNRAGQDWGLAPFNPHSVAHNDFAPLRALLASNMRHAGAIRLDHVLGLNRVYMVPHGHGAADGVYVRFPFEHLLRVIAEESVKYRCTVIGEDLGTVPEGFRDTLAKWGLWSYRVMLFERENDARFKPPQSYPAEALATFNTHDLPSFAGWMQRHDLGVKRGLGIDPGESDEARNWARAKLRESLQQYAPDYGSDELAAVASFLGQTPSKFVAMALDDILGDIEQLNVPGTTTEHPNWRRKLAVQVERLAEHGQFARVAESFAHTGRRAGI
jgi:4-alpha-glucanotransferase